MVGHFIRRQLCSSLFFVIKASLLDCGILLLIKLLIITFLNVFFPKVFD